MQVVSELEQILSPGEIIAALQIASHFGYNSISIIKWNYYTIPNKNKILQITA